MSKLLFDEQPLVVDRSLAKVFGLNEAIVIQQIHYWIKINERKKSNFHDGRYWTFNALRVWHEENFNFWSFDTVKRTFSKLEKMGILIVGNYNPDPRDRTKWYSLNYDLLDKLVAEHRNKNDDGNNNEGMHKCKSAKCTNGATTANVQNAQMQNAHLQMSKMHQPLPEITTTEKNRLIDCDKETEIWEALLKYGKSVMIRDTVCITETDYITEIHNMLLKHFPNLLDPEIVRIACRLFSDRSYDFVSFRMKIDIENVVGFFRYCYEDAIKIFKLKRFKSHPPSQNLGSSSRPDIFS